VDPDGEPLVPGELPQGALLAFGSERYGLSHELTAKVDARLSIPMRPGVSSLNLATSVAAVLFAWRLSTPAAAPGGRGPVARARGARGLAKLQGPQRSYPPSATKLLPAAASTPSSSLQFPLSAARARATVRSPAHRPWSAAPTSSPISWRA